MSSFDEKVAGGAEVTVHDHLEKREDVVEVKTVKGTEAFNQAILKEPIRYFAPTTVLLYLCLMVGFMCQTMNGFDGSLFGGLTANDTFLKFFNGEDKGIWAGIITFLYQIGSISALPFVGPFIDTWGRRWGMFIGSIIVILGTVVTGTTINNHSVGQFMGGRFLLGFGVAIVSAAGPIYVVETSHPAYRGVATAYCNTFWFTGSILSSGAVRGALNMDGNTSWQLPIWLQLLFPSLIALLCFLIPESPRWMYVSGKKEKATAMLTRWHGYGDRNSVWVNLELAEYNEYLNLEGSDKRWWDYRALFKTRASRYRLGCNVCFSMFAQWAGNGPLSYFLPAVLDTAGYHNSITKANINLGYSCFQFFFALIGARFVEKIGRRPMFLTGMALCSLCWVGVTAATSSYAASNSQDGAAAQATIAFIFIFGAVYSFNITPLQALYPVEVLSFEMRAKGMAFSNLAVNAGQCVNNLGWPVALKKITWHTYIIFCIWCSFQTVVWYFLLPETKGRTLEELDHVFEADNVVKYSLQSRKIGLNEDKTVVAVEDA